MDSLERIHLWKRLVDSGDEWLLLVATYKPMHNATWNCATIRIPQMCFSIFICVVCTFDDVSIFPHALFTKSMLSVTAYVIMNLQDLRNVTRRVWERDITECGWKESVFRCYLAGVHETRCSRFSATFTVSELTNNSAGKPRACFIKTYSLFCHKENEWEKGLSLFWGVGSLKVAWNEANAVCGKANRN